MKRAEEINQLLTKLYNLREPLKEKHQRIQDYRGRMPVWASSDKITKAKKNLLKQAHIITEMIQSHKREQANARCSE